MEVGEERADDAEVEAGRDEDVGCRGVRFDRAVSGGPSSSFEGADDCGADGDDPPTLRCGAMNCVCSPGRNGIALAVEMDFVDSLDAERGECAEANVERDARYFDSLG